MIATTMCERSPSSDYFFIKIHCIENRFPKAIKIVYGIFFSHLLMNFFVCIYAEIYFCNNFYDLERKGNALKLCRSVVRFLTRRGNDRVTCREILDAFDTNFNLKCGLNLLEPLKHLYKGLVKSIHQLY